MATSFPTYSVSGNYTLWGEMCREGVFNSILKNEIYRLGFYSVWVREVE